MKNEVLNLRSKFEIYRNNPNISYLDYSATTFIPDSVIGAWVEYHSNIGISANRNRSWLGVKSAECLEKSRMKIKKFFRADETYDLIFTKNATESLNIIANGFGGLLNEGDIILLGCLEHHSNILPWNEKAKEKGAIIVLMPLRDNGDLNYDILDSLEGKNVKIVSISLASNVTGNYIDYKKIKDFADKEKAKFIMDISQAIASSEINLTELGADAYALSAHKMYGPKSIGGLFLKKKALQSIEPYMYGGGMVWNSEGSKKTWSDGPQKFEAGTYDVGLVYAWSRACEFIEEVSFEVIKERNQVIYEAIYKELGEMKNVEIIPNGTVYLESLLSFECKDIHSHDLEKVLSMKNIIIRTGHLCSQNALRELNKVSINRVSWGIGVTDESIDSFIKTIKNRKTQLEGNLW